MTLKQKKPAATKSGASVNGVDNRTITKTEKGNSATLIQSETKNSISKPGKHGKVLHHCLHEMDVLF